MTTKQARRRRPSVATLAQRLLDEPSSALPVFARSVSELVAGTCVVLVQEPSGSARPAACATADEEDRPVLERMLRAAVMPEHEFVTVADADGPMPTAALPSLLHPWCRHRPPTRPTAVPIGLAGHRVGVAWIDDVAGTDHGLLLDLAAVAALQHVSALDVAANAAWALEAETEASVRSDELETADRALDRVGAFVGHEVRDALRATLGWSRLVLAPDLDEAVRREMARKVLCATEEAGAIVGELLESVEEVQASRTAPAMVDLNGLVAWARDVLEDRIVRRRARLLIAPLPTIDCHPTTLRRAVLEVLRNSIEHGGQFVEVHVSATVDADAVTLVIDDNGPGVPDSAREQVFAAGYGTGVGSGYGLTNVRESVERIGGRVWITASGVGGASTVIRLPRPEAAPQPAGRASV